MKLLIILLSFVCLNGNENSPMEFRGAWKSDNGVLIMTEKYFSFTSFSPSEFKYTYGGAWEVNGKNVELAYEFHTKHPEKVGTADKVGYTLDGDALQMAGMKFTRLDDGKPGILAGPWLFANRIRDGKLGTPRSDDNPRKTLKILSGTRFQWIAYNTDTKEFMGTGGGTYTTKNGKYTENIDFFSRDNSRVGASLEFDFERKDNDWHHKGLSSKGDPIHEIWRLRE